MLRWLGRHASHINRIVFAPDGHLLASSGNDATVRFWDPQTGSLLYTLPHPGPIIAISWSRDGRLFASGDIAGFIRLWELQVTGPPICIQTIQAHTVWVNGLVFAPDGGTLVSVSWDKTVKLWDVASGRLRETLSGHTDRVLRVDWSRDGRVLASSSRDQTLRLWDVEAGRCRAVLRGHTGGVDGLTFTPDGRSLISGSEDGTLRVWDVDHGQCVRVMQGYARFPYVVDWSPDSRQLISGGTDWLVTIWDTAEQSPPQMLSGHSGVVCGVAWSADGQCLASSEWDNAIRLWEPASGTCLRVLRHPDDSGNCFYDLAWSPDGRRLASGTNRHGVQVFERTAQSHAWDGRQFPTLIRHVAWSSTGVQLAGAGDDGIVYVWNPDEDTPAQQLAAHQGAVRSLAWSPDGSWLASGGGSERGELFVWDVRSGQRLRVFAEHLGMVSTVTWNTRGDLLISGGSDGRLRWWDVQRGECVRVCEGHQGTIQSIRESPDGRRLASCGDDGAIMLWDLHSGAYLQTLRPDRPYERMDITGITGLTDAQKTSLIALGALERTLDQTPAIATLSLPIDTELPAQADRMVAIGENPPVIATAPLPALDRQRRKDDRNLAIGLPFQPTSFIGRSDDLTKIANILGDPACRLLTLLGPGGIGKTRLALEVATRHTAAFADGVAFVALATVGTPNRIVSAIGDTLTLAFAEHPDPSADLIGYLRTRHMLLILDNFEHLLVGADLIADILAHAPRVTLLITSRERLNLQAEWLYDVEGLAYPSGDPLEADLPQDLTALATYSAVQLFVQRATQVLPGFALAEATIATMIRICQHVAGMPLAIELAASGVRIMPIAAIEQQIRANLDILATTQRDVPARHRSMRAVFDHSWALLSDPERTLFSRLAIFRNGFTREAVTAVLRTEPKGLSVETQHSVLSTQSSVLLTLLTALVDKSLVRYESSSERAAANAAATPRFVMLEPIREYALERLTASPDAEDIRRRHALYFTALAEAALAQSETSTIDAIDAAVAQQRREHDNLRAALQWACDTGAGLIGLRLAQALWRFWRSYGSISEGRAWLEQLLKLDQHPTDRTAIAARQRGLHAAAWLASDQHDYTQAAQLFEQSMALRRALGQTDGETAVLLNAARQARATGQYQRATTLLEDALAQHRAMSIHTAENTPARQQTIGERMPVEQAERGLSYDELGQVLRELGLVLREQGEYARATALFEEGVALHHAIGDRASAAFSMLGLADLAREQGDGAGVRKYVEPSLAILRELGIQWAIGFALNTLALGAYYAGDLTRGSTLIHESVALFRDLKADGSLAEVLITLGKIMRAQGDAAAAYGALTKSLQLALAVGPRIMVAAALEEFACVVATQGHAELTVRLLAAAAALRAEMGTPARPADRPALDHALATARATLDADTFEAMWAAGELPLEQVLSSIPGAAAFDAPPG